MSELDLIWEIAVAWWKIFFIVAGWLFTIFVRMMGIEFSLNELYWIGILSFPVMVGIVAFITYLFEKDEKKKYEKIIPAINNRIEVELKERNNND